MKVAGVGGSGREKKGLGAAAPVEKVGGKRRGEERRRRRLVPADASGIKERAKNCVSVIRGWRGGGVGRMEHGGGVGGRKRGG